LNKNQHRLDFLICKTEYYFNIDLKIRFKGFYELKFFKETGIKKGADAPFFDLFKD